MTYILTSRKTPHNVLLISIHLLPYLSPLYFIGQPSVIFRYYWSFFRKLKICVNPR